jgi:hypothetical protein
MLNRPGPDFQRPGEERGCRHRAERAALSPGADVATTSGYLDLDLDKKREGLERFLRLDMERVTGVPAQELTPQGHFKLA